MLQHTFIHAEGVGPATERKLWSAGVHSWDAFLEIQRENQASFRKLKRLVPIIEESNLALRRGDVGFFASRLTSSEQWRVYNEFSKLAAFIDIETTGLSLDFDQITLVGMHAGGSFHSFVHGKNLDQFERAVEAYPLVVTFNGAKFDLPFLKKRFKSFKPLAHIDLRYPLSRLGYKGGLKQIEREIGILRPAHLREVDGYEAVRLWSQYCRGKPAALEQLVDYCRQDVINMLPLAQRVVEKMPKYAGFPLAVASG